MTYYFGEELYHFGIKGQKWGVRRFQNNDGSYTPEGRIRYGIGSLFKRPGTKKDGHNSQKTGLTDEQKKKLVAAGTAAVATALAAYGAYKFHKSGRLIGNGLRLEGTGNLKRIGTTANQISGSSLKGLPMKKGELAVKNSLKTIDGLNEVVRDIRPFERAALISGIVAGNAAGSHINRKVKEREERENRKKNYK